MSVPSSLSESSHRMVPVTEWCPLADARIKPSQLPSSVISVASCSTPLQSHLLKMNGCKAL